MQLILRSAVGQKLRTGALTVVRPSNCAVNEKLHRVLLDNNRCEDILILGGRELRPEAEEKRKQLGIDTQTLLEGAAYNVDLLWDRPNLQWVRTRALVYFVGMLVLGTSALTIASFAVQVILTKKSASSVIHKGEAPGLK